MVMVTAWRHGMAWHGMASHSLLSHGNMFGLPRFAATRLALLLAHLISSEISLDESRRLPVVVCWSASVLRTYMYILVHNTL